MDYTKKVWQTGDIIIAEDMNNIEDGIERLSHSKADSAAIANDMASLAAGIDIQQTDLAEVRGDLTAACENIEALQDVAASISRTKAEAVDLEAVAAEVDAAELRLDDLAQRVNRKAESDALVDTDTHLEITTQRVTALEAKTQYQRDDLNALAAGHDLNATEISDINERMRMKADRHHLESVAAEVDIKADRETVAAEFKRIDDLLKMKAERNNLEAALLKVDDKADSQPIMDDLAVRPYMIEVAGLHGAVDLLEVRASVDEADLGTIHADMADMTETISAKVPKPTEDGNEGQVLQTNGDGTTSWADPSVPTSEQIGEAVSDWLEEHPEATTTVEDGSITMVKLSSEVQQSITENSGAIDNAVAIGEMQLSQLMEHRTDKDIAIHALTYTQYEFQLLEYAGYFTGNDGMGFLFFTDPHCMPGTRYPDRTQTTMLTSLRDIRHIFENTPAQFVICGGDWITVDHTLAQALLYGGRVPNLLRTEISEHAYTAIGNHDLNIERTRDYSLTEPQLARIWFDRDVGYYTLEYNKCTCVVFDSGFCDEVMSTYRWTQVDWFANLLLANTKDHLFGVIHLVKQENDTQLALNLTSVADAFNQKTSITLNGIPYDFSDAHGTFHFMMAGHHHRDFMWTMNNIPVTITAALVDYAIPDTDPVDKVNTLCVDCCYADFDAAVLHMVRIGHGESRTRNIIPNGGYQAASE